MRMTMAALGFALVLGALSVAGSARGQTAVEVAQPGEFRQAPDRRARPRVRIYRNDDTRAVYPRDYPGPNAVRECTAYLVQEFRPSGTVIVPRTNCAWRRG